MPIKESNYWLESAPEPVRGSAGPLPESVDVAIVGGGFCGLSAALTLAKRGARRLAGGGDVRLGRQQPQWRHGPDRNEASCADADPAVWA